MILIEQILAVQLKQLQRSSLFSRLMPRQVFKSIHCTYFCPLLQKNTLIQSSWSLLEEVYCRAAF